MISVNCGTVRVHLPILFGCVIYYKDTSIDYGYVVDLSSQGIPCIHVTKTMDLQSYSVGGDSAIDRIAIFTRDLKTTGLSHNRVVVVEVFGRYSGHTALRGGIGAEADCILLPEIPVDFDVVYEHMKTTYIGRVTRSDVKAGT